MVTFAASIAAAALMVGTAVFALLVRERRRPEAPAVAPELSSLLESMRAEQAALSRSLVEQSVMLAQDKLGEKLSANSRELDLQADELRRQVTLQADQAEQFHRQRQSALEQQLGDLRGELHRVTSLVSTLQNDRARQHGELVSGLQEAARMNEMVFTTTRGISNALANPKARGNWGERTAEDVLRVAGFVEGVSYHRAPTLPNGRVPDFTFPLPDGRLLCMDVKFPVDNYFRYLEATAETEREQARKRFLADVETCIKGVLERGYVDAELTVDYLLLFIPNESVYGFLHEQDPGLVDRALGRKVVLCSPYTLFSVLAVVRQSVENFQLARTSDEILQRLTAFSKQWEMFSECVDKLGRQLGTVNNTYEQLSSTRRNQLTRELDRIEDLRRRRGLDEPEAGEDRIESDTETLAVTTATPTGNLPDSEVLELPRRHIG